MHDITTRTVITYGTFDLFHIGHVRLLRRLRALGDKLVVGVSSDEFNAVKGKRAIFPYEQRREILLSTSFVDEVFPEDTWEQKPADIQRFNAKIFAMGDDWAGKFDNLSEFCEVVYLPRTEGISSTDIRKIIRSVYSEERHAIRTLAEQMLATLNSATAPEGR